MAESVIFMPSRSSHLGNLYSQACGGSQLCFFQLERLFKQGLGGSLIFGLHFESAKFINRLGCHSQVPHYRNSCVDESSDQLRVSLAAFDFHSVRPCPH